MDTGRRARCVQSIGLSLTKSSEPQETEHNRCPCRWSLLLGAFVLAGLVGADGPADNVAANVRPIPPKGVSVPETDRSALQTGVDELGQGDRRTPIRAPG